MLRFRISPIFFTMIPVSALQPDPIKGSHTIPMLGSCMHAKRLARSVYNTEFYRHAQIYI